MSKKTKINFLLVSSEGTGCFYVRSKSSKKAESGKMSLKKYDKKLRKHVLFAEKKLVYKKN